MGVIKMRLLAGAALLAAAGLGACRQDHPLMAARTLPQASVSEIATSGPPRFLGQWAAAPSACATAPWTIGLTELKSTNALTCSLGRVTPTDAGYTVDAECTVGKASAPALLIFTMTSAAPHSLALQGGPLTEPISLVRCPAPIHAAAAAPGAQG